MIGYNPSIVTTNLQLCLDAANPRSYSGSGTIWNDISSSASIYGASNYTYPSIGGSNLAKYFTFVNNGVISNNIYSSVNNISTYSQTQYTRIGWFYSTGSVEWAPIIQNSIGNNSDMGLAVSGNKLMFRQYNNTGNNGTTQGDYGISGTLTVNNNTWYQGAMAVNRTTNEVTFYLNGALDSTQSTVVIGNSASDTIVVGGATVDSYGGQRMFKGNIAMCFHYNTILTATQIAQNFNAYRGRYGI
jgi:hypothetical protein